MNDVIAFIEKVMAEKLEFNTIINQYEYGIRIYSKEYEDYINIICRNNYNITNYNNTIKKEIIISIGSLDSISFEISELEASMFKTTILRARDYSRNKTLEIFNNFLKKDNKLTDINDLDED